VCPTIFIATKKQIVIDLHESHAMDIEDIDIHLRYKIYWKYNFS